MTEVSNSDRRHLNTHLTGTVFLTRYGAPTGNQIRAAHVDDRRSTTEHLPNQGLNDWRIFNMMRWVRTQISMVYFSLDFVYFLF